MIPAWLVLLARADPCAADGACEADVSLLQLRSPQLASLREGAAHAAARLAGDDAHLLSVNASVKRDTSGRNRPKTKKNGRSPALHLTYDWKGAGLGDATWVYSDLVMSRARPWTYCPAITGGGGFKGYFGFVNGKDHRTIVFSVWHHKASGSADLSSVVHAGDGVCYRPFNHEGDGWHTHFNVPDSAQDGDAISFAMHIEPAWKNGVQLHRIYTWWRSPALGKDDWFLHAIWEGPGNGLMHLQPGSFLEHTPGFVKEKDTQAKELQAGTQGQCEFRPWGRHADGHWAAPTRADSSAFDQHALGFPQVQWGAGAHGWYLTHCGCHPGEHHKCVGQAKCGVNYKPRCFPDRRDCKLEIAAPREPAVLTRFEKQVVAGFDHFTFERVPFVAGKDVGEFQSEACTVKFTQDGEVAKGFRLVSTRTACVTQAENLGEQATAEVCAAAAGKKGYTRVMYTRSWPTSCRACQGTDAKTSAAWTLYAVEAPDDPAEQDAADAELLQEEDDEEQMDQEENEEEEQMDEEEEEQEEEDEEDEEDEKEEEDAKPVVVPKPCKSWCKKESQANGWEKVCTWKNCGGCEPCAAIEEEKEEHTDHEDQEESADTAETAETETADADTADADTADADTADADTADADTALPETAELPVPRMVPACGGKPACVGGGKGKACKSGNLGRGLTREQCQHACLAEPTCTRVEFKALPAKKQKKWRCTSLKEHTAACPPEKKGVEVFAQV